MYITKEVAVMSKKSTRLELLQNISEDNGISSDSIELNDGLIKEIQRYADGVHDYRHPSYVKHKLSDIIMIVFFATLANANEWAEIESFAKKKEAWLRRYLKLAYGIPTDDTFRIVIGNIDAGHFFRITVQLLTNTVDRILSISGNGGNIHGKGIVSVDGKVSCGSARKKTQDGEVKALQALNVYSMDYGICLEQKFIGEKTNEIPAAQEILGLMDLKNTIVTADAMNCQKGTAEAIVQGKGDYVLALKGNQPLFYEEVKRFFDEECMKGIRKKENGYKKTIEPEHGGSVAREYYIIEDTGWYREKEKWKNLRSFGMVHKTLKKPDGSCVEEDRYYICSIKAEADEFERAARGHWEMENNLHWQMDFTFRDDKNKSMVKTGAKNLQIMKKIALSILRLVKESYKISMKRIRYELSLDFENEIERMLSMLNIDSIEKALQSAGSSSHE